MGYYKVIDGVKYDKELLEAADKAVEGQHDSMISKADAETLLEQVKDGNSYTDIEKATVAYIRENYNWTEKADEWFRTEIRKWASTK